MGRVGGRVEEVMLSVVCICVHICVCGPGEPLVQLLIFEAAAMERKQCS